MNDFAGCLQFVFCMVLLVIAVELIGRGWLGTVIGATILGVYFLGLVAYSLSNPFRRRRR
jgi:hypothetical protein